MKPKVSTPRSVLSAASRSISTVGLIAVFAFGAAAQQWTGPDASNNISNANSGNVGIGTTSPNRALTVSGSTNPAIAISNPGIAYTTNQKAAYGAADHEAGMYMPSNNSTGGLWFRSFSKAPASGVGAYFSQYSENDLTSFASFYFDARKHDGSGGLTSHGASARIFSVLNNSTNLLNVLGNGNVGIGTNNPSTALHVNGIITGISTTNYLIKTNTAGNYGLYYDASNDGLSLYTNGNLGWHVRNTGSSTRVGVGTTSPAHKLDVQGGLINSSGGLCIAGNCKTSWSQIASQWSTSGSNISYASGNVGIGTTSPPTEKLEINGNLKLSGTGNLNATGTIEAGNIKAKYQDLAEWVPSSEQLSAGTVVVLDTTKSNQVISSTISYDTGVAGVISAQPGITLGEGGEGKVLVATTGRVKVKVDASRGAIQIGDLLVSSDVPGMAMKSEAVNLGGVQIHRPGTIVGKALEPLAKGKGEILVLLSLQ